MRNLYSCKVILRVKDFNEKEFDAILADFASRERRHGK